MEVPPDKEERLDRLPKENRVCTVCDLFTVFSAGLYLPPRSIHDSQYLSTFLASLTLAILFQIDNQCKT